MEKVKTSSPVMHNQAEITREIATFWNKTSGGFRAVWGPHIHHGYFEDYRETPVEAQEKLIEKLMVHMAIPLQAKILDAGCGMGGSSIYLAKKYRAEVLGISLSQKQVDMATQAAAKEGLPNVRFKVEDALSMTDIPGNTFDIVWSLESCEQFYDKKLFLEKAFRVLKPGGTLMLATWCSNAEEYQGPAAKKYKKLCTSLQLPYMPTINHYQDLLREQGFAITNVLNWSADVAKSWEIGLANLRAPAFAKIFITSGWRGLLFVKNAYLMKQGFEEGHVEYGLFFAHKPVK